MWDLVGATPPRVMGAEQRGATRRSRSIVPVGSSCSEPRADAFPVPGDPAAALSRPAESQRPPTGSILVLLP